jgi:hypothetical protein
MWSIYGLYRRIKTKESGQALPLTLAALAIGALVIGPFLSQASTALIGSRTYNTLIKATYAADAGVEHAVWNLTDAGLAAALPNVGNNTTYSLPNTVNGITPSITVTNTQSATIPIGTITDPVTDTFNFDNTNCYTPHIINISGTVYAIVYRGATDDGTIKTVNISAAGVISKTAIDTWAFSTTCYEPDITKISGNVYAIIYRGASNNGYLITVTISPAGAITKSTIGSSNFGTALYEPDINPISGTYYAITYRDAGGAGYLRTVNIANNGNLTNTSVGSWNFASAVYNPRIMKISGTVYGIVYGNVGTVMTVTISNTGVITKTAIATWAFDTTGNTPKLVLISGNVYAVAYSGTGSAGYVKTMTISTAGAINKTAISTLNFDTTGGYEPYILFATGTVYAISYRNSTNLGVVKTYTIATNGTITQTVIDTLQFDTAAGYEPWLISVGTGMYAVAYRGASNLGYLKTLGISTTAGSGAAVFSVQSVASGTTITASVSITSNVATIKSWLVQRN